MTLMDVLVDFAGTGRLGPLRRGMPLTEAEDLLGPGRPHPAIVMKGPAIDGYPYYWSGLSLVVTERIVSGIRIDLWPGSSASLPPLVLPGSESFEAPVLRKDLAAALDAAGCEHHVHDELTFGNQSCIRTRPADVYAFFYHSERDDDVPHRDRHYLTVMATR
ncbi:hypothetical protein [Allokutzneria albata]|uniref:hypothetical protein n=1 Tax=Allokutzneria albata TaxID=211114 RepID=UPI0004C3FDC2|nr:hypothetical protein [Allokutzneria albata]